MLAAAVLAVAGGFVHPSPDPPAATPVEVYQQRRARVLKALEGCVAVVSAQGELSGITEDDRQDGDFYWLTGLNEPGAHLVFAPKARYNKVVLYLRERGFGVRIEDEVQVTETGYRVLTGAFPRKLEDVEAWLAAARRK